MLLAAVTLGCVTATGVLLAVGPSHPPAPVKRLVRVAVVHRTVTKHLPRRVKVRRVFVAAPAPKPVLAPAPSAVRVTAAPVVPAYRTPVVRRVAVPRPVAPAPVAPRPAATSVHQWEEAHHEDAPNHDQAEQEGGDD